MAYSHRSRRSHEESQQTKRAEDRVWMEQLEGRVMLSGGNVLDLSDVVIRRGHGEADFQFEAEAGQKYLFIETISSGGMHVTNQDGAELDDAPDGSTRIL